MKQVHAMIVIAIISVFGTVFASDEWLHGKVVDVYGKPIAGALIWFDSSEATAMTDDSGLYQFDSYVPVRFPQRKLNSKNTIPYIKANSIVFDVEVQPTLARLEIFDLTGKRVYRIVKVLSSTGIYSLPLHVKGLAASSYLILLKINNTAFSWRALIADNIFVYSDGESKRSCFLKSNKSAEATPIKVHCTKEYYIGIDTLISSYKGELNFTMKSIEGKKPMVKMKGGDTLQYAVQDQDIWYKHWDTDTITSRLEYDTLKYFLNPPTHTLFDTVSSFITIPYRFSFWDPSEYAEGSDTIVTLLLVLYDSTRADSTPPIIKFKEDTVRLTKGDLFDIKKDMTITDEVDSHIVFIDYVKITDNIRTTAPRMETTINFDVPGTYTVCYEVIDTHMNKAKATRTIIVTKAEK